MRKLRVLDLFSGIGGFSLGLERTGGFETVAFCEIDERCRSILKRHWPDVKHHDDIRTYAFDSADIITAGFPCQDISNAGKRAGLSGQRSGLFWEVVRAIRVVRPRFALLENVAALLHRGMGDVCGAMAESGLHVEWDCISARDVRAPHYRDRVWIVAYPIVRKQQKWSVSSYGRRCAGTGTRVRNFAYHDKERELQPGWCFKYIWQRPFHGGSNYLQWGCDWRDRLSALCRMDDGVSRRLDEAKPIGNAIVTDIPELIGHAILEAESEAMSTTTIKGYRIKDGKVTKIDGYGLNASAKIAKRKSKKVKVVARKK